MKLTSAGMEKLHRAIWSVYKDGLERSAVLDKMVREVKRFTMPYHSNMMHIRVPDTIIPIAPDLNSSQALTMDWSNATIVDLEIGIDLIYGTPTASEGAQLEIYPANYEKAELENFRKYITRATRSNSATSTPTSGLTLDQLRKLYDTISNPLETFPVPDELCPNCEKPTPDGLICSDCSGLLIVESNKWIASQSGSKGNNTDKDGETNGS